VQLQNEIMDVKKLLNWKRGDKMQGTITQDDHAYIIEEDGEKWEISEADGKTNFKILKI
jgi:hypothetical protein